MNKGRLLVLTGPTGAGKSTIAENLMQLRELVLERAITCTTRTPRLGEVGGQHYHFLTLDQFETERAAKKIIVPTNAFEKWYGSRKADLDTVLDRGDSVLTTLDLPGAKEIRDFYPDVLVFYIWAPLKTLVQRSGERGMADEEIAKRHVQEPPLGREEAETFGFIFVDNSASTSDPATNFIVDTLRENFSH